MLGLRPSFEGIGVATEGKKNWRDNDSGLRPSFEGIGVATAPDSSGLSLQPHLSYDLLLKE